ncbi:B-cell receptor CD22-like [Triplophysa dalaica]|uniref:B-cell receptor CD22-like n=1 Tax=Triplophysa dalaica TaxID=1582913 RepID=UPI0024E03734|nr:B-cell receptor CD22-like [Triplophysa dalaica]
MARLLPLIVLLMIPGVYSADDGWGVTYSSSHICALKGSTVTIKCTYTYPTGHKITEVFWTNIEKPPYNVFPDLSKDSKYSERIQYLGDKQHNCSVRLTDVRHTDSHEYYFRFITDKDKWLGAPGVTLAVTDLQVESEGERVMEGHSVNLTCKSRCSLTDTSTFIWFRNTQTLNDTNKKLILPSVRRENAGDYSCTVQGHNLTSPPQRLNVIYPPDKPVISISSSGVIVEGDSVNLTCSSESNPPANISWFKENQTSSVGSGQTFSISNFNSSLSGWFYCVAQNEVGSQRSDAVSVTVDHSSYRHLLFGIASACGGLLVIAIIIVLSWFIMRKRRVAKTEVAALNQVNQQRVRGEQTTAGEAPESRDPEELQYATVHHHTNAQMRRSEENENHYGNITNYKPDASVRMARLLPLIVLLMIPGVCCQNGWGVTYSSSHICALKGSTVTIHCTYTYPTGYKITEVLWTNIEKPPYNVFPDLSKDSKYSGRIQYLGDKQHDCSVRLTDVRHTDSHKYYFRFITHVDTGKWLGAPGVTLDVTDNPVISINSSGVIVEGDSVNLTCSSESNPPVHNYSWFKEETFVGSGNIYIISNIRSDHSGQYKCKTRHTCGEKYSDSVTLNVLYPPKNVSASISSSGVIVEGDSVNLTCSSESNPPVHIYSWFKEETFVGSVNIYIISKIRSDHSGQYKCKAENGLGQKYSAVTLNVLYPPRNVSASISSSGVIVEGDSVNLTCSSESNPPANISWFKETQTSSVGSGQTFSISNFNSRLSGWFYCEAQNEVGSQRSDAVSVTVDHSSYRNLLFGITLACGGLLVIAIIIVLIWFMMRKRGVAKTEDAALNQVNQQDDLYSAVKHVDLASESAGCDDVQYECVKPQRVRGEQTTAGEAPESRDPEELQYATVHHHSNAQMRRSEENENHYGNITNYKPDASVRSNVEDTSVIYSSVK